MFMTAQELRELTGRTHVARQIAWLKLNRIPFLLDEDGRPKVLRDTISALLGAAAGRVEHGPKLRLV